MEIIDRSKATAISPVEHYSGRLLVLIVASSSPDAALDHSCGYIYKWFLGAKERMSHRAIRVQIWLLSVTGPGIFWSIRRRIKCSIKWVLVFKNVSFDHSQIQCQTPEYEMSRSVWTLFSHSWLCSCFRLTVSRKVVSPRILDELLWYYVTQQPARTRCNWLGLYIFFLSVSKLDYLWFYGILKDIWLK